MVTLNFKDIKEDIVFLFTLCYGNNLNFDRLYKLYNLSDKVFWGYLSSLTPIFKIGVKKVTMYKDNAHNIMNFLNKVTFIELTDFEKNICNFLMLFIGDIYVNGSLTSVKNVEQILKFKVIDCKLKGSKKYIEKSVFEDKDLYDVEEIVIKDSVYYRMSKAEYIVNKYFGDLKVSELNNKCLRDIQDMINDLQASKRK